MISATRVEPTAGRAGWQGLSAGLLDTYDELRRIAQHYLGRERINHTLQATALVHEAYLKLSRRKSGRFEDSSHFLNSAAREMRRILIDHARGHNTQRRGSGQRVGLQEAEAETSAPLDFDLVALDQVLEDLEATDPRKARVIELRFFAGLTIDETAELLEVSRATVIREWRLARAWLYLELERGSGRSGQPPTPNASV